MVRVFEQVGQMQAQMLSCLASQDAASRETILADVQQRMNAIVQNQEEMDQADFDALFTFVKEWSKNPALNSSYSELFEDAMEQVEKDRRSHCALKNVMQRKI